MACVLVTLAAVVLLLSSDAFEFSWRYQLPAVVHAAAGRRGSAVTPVLRAARSGQTMPLRGTFRLIK